MKLSIFDTVGVEEVARSNFLVLSFDIDEGEDYIMGVGVTSDDARIVARTMKKKLNSNRWVNWRVVEYIDKKP